MLEALGAEPPVYAHLPLLHGPDGKKLSKRHGAASVQELRDAGYLPEAVRNYLALLGWGAADDETIIVDRASWSSASRSSACQRNPARFDEQKLRWMNGRYLRELSARRADARGSRSSPGRTRPAARRSAISREKIQTLADFWPLAGFIFDGPADDPAAREKWLDADGRGALRRRARRAGRGRPLRRRGRSRRRCAAWSRPRHAKPKDVFQPMRVALAGHDGVARDLRDARPCSGATSRLHASKPRSMRADRA